MRFGYIFSPACLRTVLLGIFLFCFFPGIAPAAPTVSPSTGTAAQAEAESKAGPKAEAPAKAEGSPKTDAPAKADAGKADSAKKAEAATKTDSAPKGDTLTQIWSTRAGDLAALAKEATTLRANAESMAVPLAESLQDARTQASRLSSLFQASRGHPTEQLTLVHQMRGLQEKLLAQMGPLEEIAATIAQRLEDIASLQKDMEELAKENISEGDTANAADSTDMKNFTRTLVDAKAKLTSASTRLEKILAPAKATSNRLGQTLENTEGSLTEIWKNYYLTPSHNDFNALTSAPALFADWVSSLSSRLRFAYPQTEAEWQEAGKSFVVSTVIMALLGFLAFRGTRVLSRRWHDACMDVIKGAWVWMGAGISLLITSASPSGGIYVAFTFLGALLVIAGVASLSWRLRVAVVPVLKDEPSPLNRLIPAAAIGVFLLFSDLPTRILGFVWGVGMLMFLGWVLFRNRKRVAGTALPLLERFSHGCALWFGLASLLTTVSGYARLAILLYMVLFALVNTLTLGNALMALFSNLAEQLFNKEERPVRNAIAEAFAIPAAWIFSLLCTVPWIWAVPGARYLLRTAMAANYTVGKASFDFSRVIFIVVLFFLFRSFISLSSTSLNHLPDHMPHVERGVIPPLRTMVRYVCWALFLLIVLGSLGVNFTSLAVVAGGLSVGIGFGVQNLFNNLISGLILIFGRTILVGDVVDVAGASGTVKAINIRSTVIETSERALVYVPNSAIMSGQFSNWTRLSRMVRRSIVIGVAYGSNTELVSKLLLEAAQKQNHVRKHPAAAVFFSNFGARSLDFTLNVFLDDIDNGTSTLSAIRYDIEKAFHEHSIEIPLPQLYARMPEGAVQFAGAISDDTDAGGKTKPLVVDKAKPADKLQDADPPKVTGKKDAPVA